ncbi:MAG: histone deacetylase, partial [Candidatus Latescibacterota bacterium]
SHYDLIARTAGVSSFALDADTFLSAKSFDTARLSAGGFLAVVEAVMDGRIDNGFAMVRPPGHHAECDRAMGFCLFNNVAIAAAMLLEKYKLERVLILDWDVHHGNGTQRSFYDDPRVMYISLHQYPYYPGTGGADDTGSGDGKGYTVNIPFPGGCGDREYLAAFHSVILPICAQFEPQFVLISAGFDAHAQDPMANMNVTENGFAAMARSLQIVADHHAHGRCAAVLEGG